MDIKTMMIVFVALAALASIMAIANIRKRIVGESPLGNAIVPMLAAGIVWGANQMSDIYKNSVSDNLAPEANIQIFIESVVFGLPEIPQDYSQRSLRGAEIKQLLQPFLAATQTIKLTPTETADLNRIANSSGQAASRPVTTDIEYSLEDVANIFLPAFSYYYEYKTWSNVTKAWGKFLSKADASNEVTMEKFIRQEIANQAQAAGIFSAVPGMAIRGRFRIPEPDNTCNEGDSSLVKYELRGEDYILRFPTFRSHVVGQNASNERLAQARKFGALFEKSCITKLEELFESVSEALSDESIKMKGYLDAWQRIISSRKAKQISVSASVSNVGKFDTFMRKRVRLAVGPKGEGKKIHLTLALVDDGIGTRAGNEYIAINSRQASTLHFAADLDSEIQAKLFGAYQSEFAYLQLGALANSGAYEQEIYSAIAPFSPAARSKARSKIEELKINF